ncbi:hypothetical protein MBANPS3_003153 [Mucor bainieri]
MSSYRVSKLPPISKQAKSIATICPTAMIKALRNKGKIQIQINETIGSNWKTQLQKATSTDIKLVVELEDGLLEEWAPCSSSAHSRIRDCFLPGYSIHRKHREARIREKANFGVSSYEVLIFIGSFDELLTVGGVLFNKQGIANCFLGSSVKGLIPIMSHASQTSTTKIWTTIGPYEATTSERLLRQYYKLHASKAWSFHMKSVNDFGFFPVNPLRVKNHPLASSNDAPIVCQSAIFRVFASRNFQEDIDMKNLLEVFKTTTFVKKNYADKAKDVSTFFAMDEIVQESGKWKLVVQALAAIEKAEPEMFKDDKATRVKNKKLLLALVDEGFLSSISKKNERVIKATQGLFLK